MAYRATREGQGYVVLGETEYGPYEPRYGLQPACSPDGRKVGFGVVIGRELWWKIVDVK